MARIRKVVYSVGGYDRGSSYYHIGETFHAPLGRSRRCRVVVTDIVLNDDAVYVYVEPEIESRGILSYKRIPLSKCILEYDLEDQWNEDDNE